MELISGSITWLISTPVSPAYTACTDYWLLEFNIAGIISTSIKKATNKNSLQSVANNVLHQNIVTKIHSISGTNDNRDDNNDDIIDNDNCNDDSDDDDNTK